MNEPIKQTSFQELTNIPAKQYMLPLGSSTESTQVHRTNILAFDKNKYPSPNESEKKIAKDKNHFIPYRTETKADDFLKQ